MGDLTQWWSQLPAAQQDLVAGALVGIIIQGVKAIWPAFDATPRYIKVLTAVFLSWAATMAAGRQDFVPFAISWVTRWAAATGYWSVHRSVQNRESASAAPKGIGDQQ